MSDQTDIHESNEKIQAHRASSKLLDYFSRSNKSNINQSTRLHSRHRLIAGLRAAQVRVYTDMLIFGGTIDIDICSTFAGLFNRHWHFLESVPNLIALFLVKMQKKIVFAWLCACVCVCIYIYTYVYISTYFSAFCQHLFLVFWAFFPW